MASRSESLAAEVTAGGRIATGAAGVWRRLLTPSHADLLFAALIVWLFIVGASGWELLLVDGDAGWHIRTGEYVLDHGAVPRADLFSFSRPGGQWYAWEWLADVTYALAYRGGGLKGVVLLAGVLVALYGVLLVRFLVWKGANTLVAVTIGLMAFGASSLHFLARPHMFTLVGLLLAVWLLEKDRAQPTWAVWLLIPATAVWANLHGGFVALFPFLGALAAGGALENLLAAEGRTRDWRQPVRYSLLAAGCGAASVLNPYGLELHRHILSYLQAGWIRDTVQEFKAPSFRSESHLQFEILLFCGLLASWSLLRQRRFVAPITVVLWGHLALTSARHIPIFAVASAPVIAVELTRLWDWLIDGRSRHSIPSVLHQFGRDLAPGFRRFSLWGAVFVLVLLASNSDRLRWPRDFPAQDFPIAMVNRHADRLARERVFSSDEWADYLLYRFSPRQRVFFDGRSDYYGEDMLREFMSAYLGRHDWADVLDRYQCDLALLPPDCALASLLAQSERWRRVDGDSRAVLFARKPLGRIPNRN